MAPPGEFRYQQKPTGCRWPGLKLEKTERNERRNAMPAIKDHDQELVEMAISAYDYVVSIHPARRQEDEPAIEKSLDFLENAFCELHPGGAD